MLRTTAQVAHTPAPADTTAVVPKGSPEAFNYKKLYKQELARKQELAKKQASTPGKMAEEVDTHAEAGLEAAPQQPSNSTPSTAHGPPSPEAPDATDAAAATTVVQEQEIDAVHADELSDTHDAADDAMGVPVQRPQQGSSSRAMFTTMLGWDVTSLS